MVTTILKTFIWFLIRSLIATYRFHFFQTENKDKAIKINPNGSYLMAIWHEHVLGIMAAHAWTEPLLALASRSKDGDYAAYVAKKLGFTPVRGSSKKKGKDKGGKEALQIYIEGLSKGLRGGLTVDGPKGPRRECKPGVAIIAKETRAPILPTASHFHSCWEFNKSWDKFKIPKPFSRIDIIYGEPITVPSSATNEEIDKICLRIAENLNAEEKIIQSMIK